MTTPSPAIRATSTAGTSPSRIGSFISSSHMASLALASAWSTPTHGSDPLTSSSPTGPSRLTWPWTSPSAIHCPLHFSLRLSHRQTTSCRERTLIKGPSTKRCAPGMAANFNPWFLPHGAACKGPASPLRESCF